MASRRRMTEVVQEVDEGLVKGRKLAEGRNQGGADGGRYLGGTKGGRVAWLGGVANQESRVQPE